MNLRTLMSGCMMVAICASADAQDWVKVNSGWSNDTVKCMVMTNANILAGTPNGLYCSTNGGTSWTNVTVFGSAGTNAGNISGLATDGTSVMVKTNMGYFVSTNQGIGTWSQVNMSTLPRATIFSTSPVSPSCFAVKGSKIIVGWGYYGTGAAGAPGLAYSTDLGATWPSGGSFYMVSPPETYPERFITGDGGSDVYLVYRTVAGITTRMLAYKSTDGGTTWSGLPTPPQETSMNVTGMTALALDGSDFYIASTGYWYQNITRLPAGGSSWTSLSSALPEPGADTFPSISPIAVHKGVLWACLRDTLWQSTNDGASWTNINSNLPTLKKAIVVNDNAIYVGTNTGVYRKVHNTVGALSITLYNDLSDGLTGPTAKVRLYNYLDQIVAEKAADSNSVVSFPNLSPGTYSFEVLNAIPTPWGEQYWGWQGSVVVSADVTTYVTHTHNTPLITAMHVYDNATNELFPLDPLTPKTISLGTQIRIDIEVANPAFAGASVADAYPRIYFDRDRALPYDGQVVGMAQTYATGQSRTVSLYATPAQAGNYSLSVSANTVFSGGPLVTDGGYWHGPLFTVTVSVPKLISPDSGATEVPVSPSLRWTRPVGATAFHIQVGTDSSLVSSLILNDSAEVDTSRSVAGLQYAQTYYWDVRAKDGSVFGPWSERRPFKTKLIDTTIPIMIAPAPSITGLDTPVTVRWTRPVGATSFHLQVGGDSTFTSGLIQRDYPTVDTFAVLHSLSFLTSYWWHVNAYNAAAGVSTYSEAWKFSTGLSLPNVVVLVQPSQNTVVNADTLSLRWNSTGPFVDKYWMEYSIDSAFTIKATDSLLTDTSTVIRSMVKSIEYYWRVRAHNLAGWGPYSTRGHFVRSMLSVANPLQGVPNDWVLQQNYPNPFNPTTTISFGLPVRARVRLVVYSPLGEEVAEVTNTDLDPGYHSVSFNAIGLPSGVYFYRMQAGSYTATKRLLLLK